MPMPPADCGRNDATSVHRNGVAHRNAVASINPATMRLARRMRASRKDLTLRRARSARLEGWAAPRLVPTLRDAVLRTAPQGEVCFAIEGFNSPHGRLVPWS